MVQFFFDYKDILYQSLDHWGGLSFGLLMLWFHSWSFKFYNHATYTQQSISWWGGGSCYCSKLFSQGILSTSHSNDKRRLTNRTFWPQKSLSAAILNHFAYLNTNQNNVYSFLKGCHSDPIAWYHASERRWCAAVLYFAHSTACIAGAVLLPQIVGHLFIWCCRYSVCVWEW